MFRCHVFGKSDGEEKMVNEVFDIDGKPVRVKSIPPLCTPTGRASLYP